MKRREIIKLAALATGAAVSLPLLSSLLSGCQTDAAKEKDNYLPKFFSSEEFSFIKDLADVILPKTDSPSATEVGVPNVVDTMVGKVYKKEDQESYQKNLGALIKYLTQATPDKNFIGLSADKKLKMIQQFTKADDAILKDVQKAFMDLRQQTVAYYLSTEEVGTKFLNYLPVPGKYEACISLEETGGKAWAL